MKQNKAGKKIARKQTIPRKTTASGLHNGERWDIPQPLLAIIDEHKYVSRLLTLLESEAKKLKSDRTADYECMQDVMHYMVNYPDRYHHPKENLIFDRMSGLAPKTAEAVARLRVDHRKMAVQAQALYEKISAQRRSTRKPQARTLADEICLYASALRDHMQLEESIVFQPAQTSLKADDWEEIDRAIKPVSDPVFSDRISEQYISLMQRYINDFASVSSSGSFPVQLVESAASTIERAIYTAAEMRHLPRQFAETTSEISKARGRRLVSLSKVRGLKDMQSWFREAKTANTEEWRRIADQIAKAVDEFSQPVDVEQTRSAAATITLHTEKDIRSYQEKPYEPARSPRISWQAVMVNLLMRMTIKPMMRHANPTSKKKSERFRKPSELVPPGTRVEPVEQSDFHAAWILPEDQPVTRQTILHLPGGGFFAPASAMHRQMVAKLARRTGSRGMLVNYRLLPKHPFPAGLEDALAAYRFLLDEGVSPGEIALCGDSAGGCLALALMLAARDDGLPLPASCALLSPLTDLTYSTAARQTNRWKDPLLPTRRKMGAYQQYAGEVPADDPLVSPIYGSFKGFPPTFALVSSTETLLDDSLVVARKARAQGVDFDVEVWESLPHAWPLFSFMPEADGALERVIEFFEDHLSSPLDRTRDRTLSAS